MRRPYKDTTPAELTATLRQCFDEIDAFDQLEEHLKTEAGWQKRFEWSEKLADIALECFWRYVHEIEPKQKERNQ